MEEEIKVEEKKTKKENLEDEKEKKRRKRRKIRRIISDIIVLLLFVIVLFEIIIGMVNMNRINNKQKPAWYISKKEEVGAENKSDIKTIYNLGLYKIEVTDSTTTKDNGDTSVESKVTLVPFFY